MEFKTTSISRQRRQTGFTLVEIMVAGILGLLVATMIIVVTIQTSRSIYSLTDSVGINSQSRYAMDRMSQKIRQATNVLSFSASSLSLKYKGRTLSYSLVNDTLVEVDNGTTNWLVDDCDNLIFSLYKRNPITNSFNQFPTLTAMNEAKVVQVSWQCISTRAGRTGVGETSSARIVLRAK